MAGWQRLPSTGVAGLANPLSYTRLMPVPHRGRTYRAPCVRPRVRVAAFAACSLVVTPSAQPQRAGSGGSNIISPSVIENAFVHEDESGAWRLDLLVLWRGAPGWFLAGGANGTRSSGGNGRPTILHNRHADVNFYVIFDAGAGVARVAGAQIRLNERNVVLVDGMPHAMKIVGTRMVNSRIEQPPIGLQAVYRASPELDAFIRCDVTGGNHLLEMFRAYCTWPPSK